MPKRGTTLASKRKDALKPPRGAVLIGDPDDDAGVVETGEFDWSSVKDDEDVELWGPQLGTFVSLFKPYL